MAVLLIIGIVSWTCGMQVTKLPHRWPAAKLMSESLGSKRGTISLVAVIICSFGNVCFPPATVQSIAARCLHHALARTTLWPPPGDQGGSSSCPGLVVIGQSDHGDSSQAPGM